MFKDTDLFLKDFQTIVNIDSSSDHLPGIETVARFFQKRFSAIGLAADVLFQGDAKVPCLQAVSGPRQNGTAGNKNCGNTTKENAKKDTKKKTKKDETVYDLMFLGHMDTVFPFGEVEKRQFSIQGDKAFGPGVCDMKGGLLVALHVLETLAKDGALEKLSICVAFNGDEETGSTNSKEWIRSTAKKSRNVFVFEPCRSEERRVGKECRL